MSYSARYESDRSVVDRLKEHMAVSLTAGFVVCSFFAAHLVNLVGYPTVAAMIVAFAVLLVVVTVLFVIIPVSALSLLD